MTLPSMSAADKASLRITVVGAGAFGTAMAFLAGRNGHDVRVYARDEKQVEALRETRHNPKYLSTCELPEGLTYTSDVAEALAPPVDIIVNALPAQKTPDWLREHADLIPDDVLVCSTAKGLYLPTKQLLSEAMADALLKDNNKKNVRFAFLSGPSFAAQIVAGHPTAVVVAARLLADAVTVQFALSNSRFRIYASLDTVGVELGGALKNPLAIGAGMIEGGGFGINTMAAYVTRATRELSVLTVAMGGKAETVGGLSGVGDLMLTAFGDLSRNRTCGVRLAKGEPLEAILATTTVEGVPTAQVAIEFARRCNLDLPLFTVVHAILQGNLTPRQALDIIMNRPLGTEVPLL
mmetsp:Transcript_17021/g.68628  ORF Transcript_17021/g.68628 Transcript_17021/m.68628 type:complete len:351 (-) Transcript_17021:101-1153(-)